jgi:hypothetical protein
LCRNGRFCVSAQLLAAARLTAEIYGFLTGVAHHRHGADPGRQSGSSPAGALAVMVVVAVALTLLAGWIYRGRDAA